MDIDNELRKKFMEMVTANGWLGEPVGVSVKTLTSEEAIGRTEHQDYPLTKGREHMVEAVFHGSRGQAFTDRPGEFQGSLKDVSQMALIDNFRRGVFISVLNAVSRHLGLADKTIHCRDDAPPRCAVELARYVSDRFGHPKIALIGLQPRMLQALSRQFEVRATDLDPDNIGQKKFGVLVDDPSKTPANIAWCDLVLATGSMAANGTLMDAAEGKPLIYFGVTVAAAAELLNFERFCPLGN